MINGIIISGCSGVGKSTVVQRLLERNPHMVFSVSYTTRPPRKGEIDGIHYKFVSKEEFEKKIAEGFFLEWEEVYGQFYGTPKNFVDAQGQTGRTLIFELDSKGALNLKKRLPQLVSIAIIPPSARVLLERLKQRNTDRLESLEGRIKAIKEEIQRLAKCDFCVVNDDLETAVSDVELIISAQRLTASACAERFQHLQREIEEMPI